MTYLEQLNKELAPHGYRILRKDTTGKPPFTYEVQFDGMALQRFSRVGTAEWAIKSGGLKDRYWLFGQSCDVDLTPLRLTWDLVSDDDVE